MATIKPFKGVRPLPEKVAQVASKPYDVLNTEEARLEAKDNPYSFLHVVKPEMNFPADQDPYAPEVYKKGKENFFLMEQAGVFFQETSPSLYLYELVMGNHSQTGIMACAAVEDYFNDVIKKHELTRPDKEEDRKNHVRVGEMHAEPVFFAYKKQPELDDIVDRVKKAQDPVYDFMADDGVIHRLWVISDGTIIDKIVQVFDAMPATYVADGHHRTAAAALVGKEIAEKNPNHDGTEPYNYFLAVHFPDDQLSIIDYNRVVKDLNGLSSSAFLTQLEEHFEITEKGVAPYKPACLHEMGMYLEGKWYKLSAKSHTFDDNDKIRRLDVTILSQSVLKPVLGIENLRTDKRIDFVGGIRGLEELQKRVDNGEMKVAFALYPVSMQQLMDIADNGLIMPPKTTWFEPKLRSGLVIHRLT